jgi:predicted ATPase/class 3 adenylate cyclase/DNA-binding CsgD family transcriptional regulator
MFRGRQVVNLAAVARAAPASDPDDLSDTVGRARALFGPLRWDDQPVSGRDFVLPIGTVTLLLADVEGSTRAWEDRPDEMTFAVRELDVVLGELVAAHDGVRPIEQGEGDSFVIAFARASSAVSCALALQERLHGSPLRLRIGVHTGEVQLRDEGNYVGPAINRAGRLRDAAHGGQTVCSQATYELVRDRLPEGSRVVDLGSHRLRDLGRPEHVFQLVAPGATEHFPPLRTIDRARHNLPVQLSTFVGREPELAVLAKLGRETRMLTLTGAGGCGKTRLAIEYAARRLDDATGGTWFADLSLVTDPKAVTSAVANALGVRDQPGRRLVDVVAEQLDDGAALLVLDNCEHVLAGAADLVEHLLGACASLHVLATSREPLGVPGETAWRVPSLSVPSKRAVRVDALAQFEAVELFVDRARRARPNFQVTNETAPAVAAICQRLDGIPLAIELAAARVRVLTAQEILDGLDDRFHLLTGGARTVVARQQTLRASVDWSFQLLRDEERIALARLAVCAGGFTLDAAETVAGAAPLDRLGVLDLLQGLVDKSLLTVDEVAGASRYRMLETIRQYALEQLDASGEATDTRVRHAAFFVALAERAEPHLEGADQEQWADTLEREWRNVRAAFDSAEAIGDAATLLRLVGALFWFFVIRGHLGDGWRVCHRALQVREGADDALVARALVAAGHIAFFRVDPTGLELGDEAVAAAQRAGDRRSEGRARYHTAWWRHTTERERAMADIDDGIAAARETGDDWGLAMMFSELGTILVGEGNPRGAIEPLEAATAVCARLGEHYIVNTARYHLGRAQAFLGRTREAVEMLDAVIAHAQTTGDTFSMTMAQADLALVHSLRGEHEDALRNALENLRRFENDRLPWVSHAAQAHGTTGSVHVYAGRYADALPHLEAALRITRAVPTTHVYTAATLAEMATCHVASGDPAAARVLLDEAVALLDGAPSWATAMTAEALAQVAYALGDTATAQRLAYDAVAIASDLGNVSWLGGLLRSLDVLVPTLEDAPLAARLVGALDAGFAAAECARPMFAAATHEATVARLRAEVGDEYDALFAEGRAMSIEDAAAYARRGRGPRRRPTTGWESLTPAERQVVELVAQGLSNPQIGERLFVSRKTVTTHLSHVFAKLGMTSRAELSAEAARRGLGNGGAT